MRSLLLSLLAVSLLTPPAHAWHDMGHKLTTALAFGFLSVEQRHDVAAILRAHPRFSEDFAAAMPADVANGSESDQDLWLFLQASVWPDLVPDISDRVREEYDRDTWHYINLPLYLTERDEQELAGTLDENVSMKFTPPLRRGLNIAQALQGNVRVWRHAGASAAEKAVALCWIFHLVGDLHQPLHNVSLFSTSYFPEGDRGGNSIAVKRDPENTNLHAVWDGLMTADEQLTADDDTRALLQHDVADIDSISSWSRRHRDLAVEFVYTADVKNQILEQNPSEEIPLVELPAQYIASARKVARSQVIIAGYRIAALISK